MQGDVLSSVLLPGILAFIMFSLGLGLTPADFRRILAQPRALLVGVLCHFLLLPLVCFLMLKAFGVTGVFAVGFMILAACPTGTTSNLLTYLARGDVALALSFTAIASVITIFTLPLLVTWSLGHFLGEARAVNVPVGLMMGQVAVVLAIPASLGMFVRHRWPQPSLAFEPRATRIATGLFLFIVVAAVVKNWALLRANFSSLAPFALVLNLSMLCLGFGVAWLARHARAAQRRLTELQAGADQAARIRTALDNTALPVRIADADGTVVYVNQALDQVLHRDVAAFRREQPAFDPDRVVGHSIGLFYADPDAAVTRLKALRQRATTVMPLGGRQYSVTTTPIFDGKGLLLGTVGQWLDLDDQMRAEAELDRVISAATLGDLATRIEVRGLQGFHRKVGDSLNELLATFETRFKRQAVLVEWPDTHRLPAQIEVAFDSTSTRTLRVSPGCRCSQRWST